MTKLTPIYLFTAALFITCMCGSAAAQVAPVTDTVFTPARDTVIKYKVIYNADFDVIILRNGDIVYGLVKEVGLELIKYQRTDIPNGPLYTIPKWEVYAISYRNQLREIINPVVDPRLLNQQGYGNYQAPDSRYQTPDSRYRTQDGRYRTPDGRYYNPRTSFLSRNGSVSLGVGFIRGFTKVKDAGGYSSSGSPVVNIAYDALYRSPVRLGAQLSFGSHKFSGQDYSTYDSTQSAVSIKENFFALHVYARYSYLLVNSKFQPYALLGLGIISSNIRTNREVNFLNRSDKVLLVTSGARAVGLNILARAGTGYVLNNKIRVFGDVGAGPYILNIGVTANVN